MEKIISIYMPYIIFSYEILLELVLETVKQIYTKKNLRSKVRYSTNSCVINKERKSDCIDEKNGQTLNFKFFRKVDYIIIAQPRIETFIPHTYCFV